MHDAVPHSNRLRRLLVAGLALAACLAVGWLAYLAALAGYTHTQLLEADQRADFYALSLKSELERYETLPRIAAFEHTLSELLRRPDDRILQATANRYLENVEHSAAISAAFLIDRQGLTLASSNWRAPGSFVGQNYAFRPYFHEAMRSGFGRFYAIGNTTGTPGYFLAAPIRDEGVALGAVAVKVSLDNFASALAKSGDTVLLVDDNGVIFLSSVPAWTYHTLAPLMSGVLAHLRQTRQYGDHPLAPLGTAPGNTGWPDKLHVALPGRPSGDVPVQYRPVGRLGWQVAVLVDPRQARQSALAVGSAVASTLALLLAVALAWQLRQKRFEERRQAAAALRAAYAELEQRIAQRTAELSAANVELAGKVEALDRTQRMLRETRDAAVQAGKLAVLGQMAAGITHELNQPLAALNTLSDNTQLLIERGLMDEVRHNMTLIGGLANRMGRIIAHIKAFARKGEQGRERVQVYDTIRQSLVLVEPRRKEIGIPIEVLPEEGEALFVLAGAIRLEQVLVNLLLNGLDAMGGLLEPGRKLTVTVTALQGKIEIAVTDDGPGLSEEAKARLFEPFFTSKPAGQGLGLGLAISQAIMEDFGGQLEAGNADGRGACFILRLEQAD
jgi:two-component system C4-dicarboxylate transport sensor histidine kinase DctB